MAEPISLQTMDRALDCGTTARSARLQFFDNGAAFDAWSTAADAGLRADDTLGPEQPLLVIEMGRRKTAGYFLKLQPDAVLDTDGVLQMRGEWTRPGKDRIAAQVLTAPCVLTALPPRDYAGFRIVDQRGELRASLTLDRGT